MNNPKENYKLYEIDIICKKAKRINKDIKIDKIDDARVIAKELAKGWCVDEEPERIEIDNKGEIWIGESDFGIMIKKIKE